MQIVQRGPYLETPAPNRVLHLYCKMNIYHWLVYMFLIPWNSAVV